jgi:hypothetical protein
LPTSGLTSVTVPGSSDCEVRREHRLGRQVVDRNVKEALDLRRVQVQRQHAIRARRRQQVGHQLRRDRHAALVLAVLAGVAEVRQSPP